MDGISPRYTPERWFTEIDFGADKRLEAAFALSSELHEGQERDSGRPYVEHPVLVYNILKKFGCNDVQKAVALLHDTVEDNDGLTAEKGLKQKLSEKLKQGFGIAAGDALPVELQQWAEKVCHGVGQLSNDANLYEGKRTWQANKVRSLSNELKEVKIADQAASVIDGGILNCNIYDPVKLKKEKGFALKGLDLSRNSIAEDGMQDERLQQFYSFYKHVMYYFLTSYNLAQAGNHVRVNQRKEMLDIGEMVLEARQLRSPFRAQKVKAENVVHIYSPSFGQPELWDGGVYKGIARITLSEKTGRVVGMGVAVSEKEDANAPANAIADRLRNRLEEHSSAYVTTGSNKPHLHELGLEEYNNRNVQVRDFTVNPPLRLARFLQIAKDANAIDDDFHSVMEHKAKMHNSHRGGR